MQSRQVLLYMQSRQVPSSCSEGRCPPYAVKAGAPFHAVKAGPPTSSLFPPTPDLSVLAAGRRCPMAAGTLTPSPPHLGLSPCMYSAAYRARMRAPSQKGVAHEEEGYHHWDRVCAGRSTDSCNSSEVCAAKMLRYMDLFIPNKLFAEFFDPTGRWVAASHYWLPVTAAGIRANEHRLCVTEAGHADHPVSGSSRLPPRHSRNI